MVDATKDFHMDDFDYLITAWTVLGAFDFSISLTHRDWQLQVEWFLNQLGYTINVQIKTYF